MRKILLIFCKPLFFSFSSLAQCLFNPSVAWSISHQGFDGDDLFHSSISHSLNSTHSHRVIRQGGKGLDDGSVTKNSTKSLPSLPIHNDIATHISYQHFVDWNQKQNEMSTTELVPKDLCSRRRSLDPSLIFLFHLLRSNLKPSVLHLINSNPLQLQKASSPSPTNSTELQPTTKNLQQQQRRNHHHWWNCRPWFC